MIIKKWVLSAALVATLAHAKHLTQESYALLTQPVAFTRTGVEFFFTSQFNAPEYSECVMPSHFGHLTHFLHYGSTLERPQDFVTTIFDIFHTRMKDTHWVNALAFTLFLEQLPRYTQQLCEDADQHNLKQDIQDILYKRLFARFTQFSNNPMDGINGLDTLVQTIDDIVNPPLKDRRTCYEKWPQTDAHGAAELDQ